MSLMKEAVTETPCFPNLSKFLLIIPHSNCFCEGVFSTVKKILTDSRHNLGKDVITGHAHPSVYEDETVIRDNLFGLLIIAKKNIFKQQQITCYEWQPLRHLFKSAKSAAYRNLTSAAK